jgi:hypothetical protein
MIDIKRYSEMKEKGLVTLAKAGDAYAASWYTFDPVTGEKSEKPVSVAFDKTSIEEMKKQADELSASVAVFLEDLKALG